MLIKALCDYDDMLSGDGCDIIPVGFSKQKVHYKILLTPDGDITDIIDIRKKRVVTDKKGKEKEFLDPIEVFLPERTQKTSIDANIIEHRPLYIFGLNYDKGVFNPSDNTDKAKKSNKCFKEVNSIFFENLNSNICRGYYNFIQKWNSEEQMENPILQRLGKEYLNAYFIFGLDGNPAVTLHEDDQLKHKYNTLFCADKYGKSNDVTSQRTMCAITGDFSSIAIHHDKIKNIGDQAKLVSFKKECTAFSSYGKTEGENCNISEIAMKKYTKTLNYLSESHSHHQVFDEITLVYFAIKKNDENECSIFTDFLAENPQMQAERGLSSMYSYAKTGIGGDICSLGVNENVVFYVAGLAGLKGRIALKFMLRNRFGDIMSNILQHQEDMRLFDNNNQIYFSWIKKELISPKATGEKVSPPLISAIFQAILTGQKYPEQLLSTVIRRIKTDSDKEKNHFIKMNDTRIGIIKACINRKLRNSNLKEEIKVSLDLENKNAAYLCGRLFAVLEKIQQDSVDGTLNKTIKDSFFTSACSKPSTVFPKLIQLSQNHLKKLTSPVYYNILLGEIISGLNNEFPNTLLLDEQGKFIVGYYQQNKELYAKKEVK